MLIESVYKASGYWAIHWATPGVHHEITIRRNDTVCPVVAV